jgi:hypothetical protein
MAEKFGQRKVFSMTPKQEKFCREYVVDLKKAV